MFFYFLLSSPLMNELGFPTRALCRTSVGRRSRLRAHSSRKAVWSYGAGRGSRYRISRIRGLLLYDMIMKLQLGLPSLAVDAASEKRFLYDRCCRRVGGNASQIASKRNLQTSHSGKNWTGPPCSEMRIKCLILSLRKKRNEFYHVLM